MSTTKPATTKIIDSLAKKLGLYVELTDVETCNVLDRGVIVVDGGYPYVLMCLRNMWAFEQHKTVITKLTNRVNAVNNVHSFLDVVSAEMKEHLSEGYKISVAGPNFLKKDHDAITDTINQYNPDGKLQVELIVKSYSIQIKAKAMYYLGKGRDGPAEYYSNWVNVWDRSVDKPEERAQGIELWSLDELIRLNKELPQLEKDLSALKLRRAETIHKLGEG